MILIMNIKIVQIIFYYVLINTRFLNVLFENFVFLSLNNQIFKFIIQDFSLKKIVHWISIQQLVIYDVMSLNGLCSTDRR